VLKTGEDWQEVICERGRRREGVLGSNGVSDADVKGGCDRRIVRWGGERCGDLWPVKAGTPYLREECGYGGNLVEVGTAAWAGLEVRGQELEGGVGTGRKAYLDTRRRDAGAPIEGEQGERFTVF
jgi:hypothetical protein